MKQAQLVARADQNGVYIAAKNGRPAKYYKHDNVEVYIPEKKAKPSKALEMAYRSFVYARGRFTPGGMSKYLQFRNNGNKKPDTSKAAYTRNEQGTVRMINTVFHMFSEHSMKNISHIHGFRLINA